MFLCYFVIFFVFDNLVFELIVDVVSVKVRVYCSKPVMDGDRWYALKLAGFVDFMEKPQNKRGLVMGESEFSKAANYASDPEVIVVRPVKEI